MILKWVGAAFIIVACSGYACLMSAFHKREVKSLKSLLFALDYMECELQYRMSSLSELCKRTSYECTGIVQKVFISLSNELDEQMAPNVRYCMNSVLSQYHDIPIETKYCLSLLGDGLGQFDLQGQIKSLNYVKEDCSERLKRIQGESGAHLRSYQTLGLCAGAAIIILLM